LGARKNNYESNRYSTSGEVEREKQIVNFNCGKRDTKPKLIQNDATMISKIEYIHYNPIKRGYVEEDWHWRYSSARDYKGLEGLIEVEKFF